MKIFKMFACGAMVLMVCVLFFSNGRMARSADEENHCFTCHTNAGKLIKITREIAKADKDKPGGSAETEGEG